MKRVIAASISYRAFCEARYLRTQHNLDPGFYERFFFLKCCMQADIRQLKQHQKWFMFPCTVAAAPARSPSPLTKQILTNGVIMNLFLGYGCYLMRCCWLEAMDMYRTIAAPLHFCCVKANDHNQQDCIYAKFSNLYFNHLPCQTDTPPSVNCISNEQTSIVKKILLHYLTNANSSWKIHLIY